MNPEVVARLLLRLNKAEELIERTLNKPESISSQEYKDFLADKETWKTKPLHDRS